MEAVLNFMGTRQMLRLLVLAGGLMSCENKTDLQKRELLASYYQLYNQHQDLDAFMTFYDDNIKYQDIVTGEQVIGKTQLKQFFDWKNPHFTALDSTVLLVEKILVDKDQVVVSGHFTKFEWAGQPYGPMHFTSIFTFNNSGKIIKQSDWINYPSTLLDYETRKNSNAWLQ